MRKPNKLEPQIVSELLPRLKDEFNAYYFYRSASNWCRSVGYFKAADYFAKESADELEHAKKLENYLVDWNVIPELPTIDAPVLNFNSYVDIVEQAYQIEYSLYLAYELASNYALDNKDTSAFNFLQFYVDTQVSSVAEYSDKLNTLEGVNPMDKFNLLLLEENIFG